jgi:hypothetical protein
MQYNYPYAHTSITTTHLPHNLHTNHHHPRGMRGPS